MKFALTLTEVKIGSTCLDLDVGDQLFTINLKLTLVKLLGETLGARC